MFFFFATGRCILAFSSASFRPVEQVRWNAGGMNIDDLDALVPPLRVSRVVGGHCAVVVVAAVLFLVSDAGHSPDVVSE